MAGVWGQTSVPPADGETTHQRLQDAALAAALASDHRHLWQCQFEIQRDLRASRGRRGGQRCIEVAHHGGTCRTAHRIAARMDGRKIAPARALVSDGATSCQSRIICVL